MTLSCNICTDIIVLPTINTMLPSFVIHTFWFDMSDTCALLVMNFHWFRWQPLIDMKLTEMAYYCVIGSSCTWGLAPYKQDISRGYFNIKMPTYQCRNSYYKDKFIMRILISGKTAFISFDTTKIQCSYSLIPHKSTTVYPDPLWLCYMNLKYSHITSCSVVCSKAYPS